MAGVEECEGFTVIGSNFGGGGMPGSDGAGKKVRSPDAPAAPAHAQPRARPGAWHRFDGI